MESVYIHIPFCRNICTYCDFPKGYYKKDIADEYLDNLEKEINDIYEDSKIKTIYIGGGTPSVLTYEQLIRLYEITSVFDTEELLEFTMECNLEDITDDLIKFLKDTKINRISIGIQTFDKKYLEFLGRKAEFKDALNKINMLKSIGITNINLDLMYAFPDQKLSSLKKDLKLFLKLKPTHISAYSLIIEEHTKIFIDGEKAIAQELDREMYDYIGKKLKSQKFNHYEISNYALTGYMSKHNLKYWHNEEYYGFGAGAHGFIQGFRYENVGNAFEYNRGHYREKEYLVSSQEMMENELMLGLRLTGGINVRYFYDKYNVNVQDVFPIKPLLKNGELAFKNGYIYIPSNKLYIMDNILLKLI